MRAPGLQIKNAPKTPLIAPLAPIKGVEEFGCMSTLANAAAIPVAK